MAMTGRRRRIAPWWPSSVVCLLWLLYCCGSALATEQAPASAGIEQQTRQGTITLTLRTDRQSMGVVDTLRVILTVVAPPASTVVFSEPGSTLGPFQVLRMLPKKPQGLGPEQQQWQQEYFLTVEQPGTLTLPALEVQVRSASGDVTLHTEPVTLAVTSSLPDNADVQSPRDIAPPVLLGRRGLPPWVWVALAGLGGVSAGAWWLWRYWQRPPPALPPRPAHLLALEALRRLQRDDFITQWRVDEFYVRLSGILRRYVEWRFGVRAPEQTTEEFLEAVLSAGGLIASHRDLLATFLQQCDMVKFALHQPVAGDMQRALESARVFIEQTADSQVCVAVSAAPEGEACA